HRLIVLGLGTLSRQSGERVHDLDTQRPEVLLVAGQNDKAVPLSRCRNRDVLEAGADPRGAGDVHQLSGFPRSLEVEWQDSTAVVVADFSPPFRKVPRLLHGTGASGFRNAVF